MHTSEPGLKVMPQFLTRDVVGYLAKAGPKQGLAYAGGAPVRWLETCVRRPGLLTARTSSTSAWGSVRGRKTCCCTAGTPSHELSVHRRLPEFFERWKAPADAQGRRLFAGHHGIPTDRIGRKCSRQRGAPAFSPSWSPDGQSIVFGYGGFLQSAESSAGQGHDGAARRHERDHAH